MKKKRIQENVRQAIGALKAGDQPDLSLGFGEYDDDISHLSNVLENEGEEEFKEALATFLNSNDDLRKILREQEGWTTYDLEDIDEYDPEIEFLIDGLIASESVNLVVGDPGSLKSIMSIYMGMTVATGQTFLPSDPWVPGSSGGGFETQQGNVLMVDLENRVEGTMIRMRATEEELEPSDPSSFQLCPQPEDPSFRFPQSGQEELANQIQRADADLVIIDNLRDSCIGTDENHSEMAEVMTQFERIADDCGVALVILHHTRKNKSGSGRDGNNIRGSSVIEGAADSVLMVDRCGENDQHLDLKLTKNRFGKEREFGAHWLYSNDDSGNLSGSCFYYWAGSSGLTPKKNEARKEILDVLSDNPGQNQSELVDHLQEEGIGKNTVIDVLELLEDKGEIEVSDGRNNANVYELA